MKISKMIIFFEDGTFQEVNVSEPKVGKQSIPVAAPATEPLQSPWKFPYPQYPNDEEGYRGWPQRPTDIID